LSSAWFDAPYFSRNGTMGTPYVVFEITAAL
jgi:hypothetical protein